MNLIITIIAILLFSYLLTLLGKKLKISTVVALICSGLIITVPLIKTVILEPHINFISGLGDFALLCLMFLAGLESSWRTLYKEKKDALFIAISAALTPFLLGFAIFSIMGFSFFVSSIVGICMSITAEGTTAKVLMETRKLKSRVGAAMMDAGIFDDILGLSLFILITSLLRKVYLKEDILIAGAIISFFAGILVQIGIKRNNLITKYIEKILLIIIIPFFFISMGIHFDWISLFINPHLLLIVILTAIAGKLIGTFITKPINKFNWKQLHIIGWGMNSRGAVELALALIAFRNGLIPVGLYSGLVVMALITTLIFPFFIIGMIKKEPGIMN